MPRWEYAFLMRDMGLNSASGDDSGGSDGESYTLDFGHSGEGQVFTGVQADLMEIMGRLGSEGWELAGLLPVFSKSLGHVKKSSPETSDLLGEFEMGTVHMAVATLVFKRQVA
jgi:hypothetical protein